MESHGRISSHHDRVAISTSGTNVRAKDFGTDCTEYDTPVDPGAPAHGTSAKIDLELVSRSSKIYSPRQSVTEFALEVSLCCEDGMVKLYLSIWGVDARNKLTYPRERQILSTAGVANRSITYITPTKRSYAG